MFARGGPTTTATAPVASPFASSSQSPSAPKPSAAAISQPFLSRAFAAAQSARRPTPIAFHAQIDGPSSRWKTAIKKLIPPASASHRSEEHTSELQSLMRNPYAVFCLKKKKKDHILHGRTTSYSTATQPSQFTA